MSFENITVNLAGKARRETLYGRDWLVAPMTLIVPGVLNGSKGPLYYPEDEVQRYPELWNHKPITVNHPAGGGNDPKNLNQSQLGFLLNARYESGRLVADGWFDLYRVMQIDRRILENLSQGNPIELSTGLSVEEDTEGVTDNSEFNGKKYKAIARNYRPDHLAVLLDSVGACSIKDGCGVLVNQENERLVNALSHEEIREEIWRELKSLFRQDEPRAFIVSVFDGFFIYEQGDKLFQRTYTLANGKVSIGGSPQEVRKDVEFKPITNTQQTKYPNGDCPKETNDMAKKELIDSLIANCDCWSEEDRETLNKMDDKKIQSLDDKAKKAKETEEVANAAKQGFEDQQGNAHVFNEETKKWELKEKKKTEGDGDTNNKEGNGVNNQQAKSKQLSAEEWFEQAPPEVQSAVRNAMDVENRERQKLVNQLTSHIENEEQKTNLTNRLKDKPLDELRDLVALAPTGKSDNPFSGDYHQPNYTGAAGGSSQIDNVQAPEPIPDFTWDFSAAK